MIHDLVDDNRPDCPNCGELMYKVVNTTAVYFCVSQPCGWIAGTDLEVSNYLDGFIKRC